VDRAHVAEIAADPAFDTVPWQTGIADNGLVWPRRRTFDADERQWLARCQAIAAESAFALSEIDSRESAVPGDQNPLRARTQAVPAARAAVDKSCFG